MVTYWLLKSLLKTLGYVGNLLAVEKFVENLTFNVENFDFEVSLIDRLIDKMI